MMVLKVSPVGGHKGSECPECHPCEAPGQVWMKHKIISGHWKVEEKVEPVYSAIFL